MKIRSCLLLAAGLVGAVSLRAWDAPGHQIVNQLALDSLPADFPAFVRTPDAVARIEFLAGEPDRWSHAVDKPLKHYNWPDHFLDVEMISMVGLDPLTVSSFRNEFVADYAAARATHLDKLLPFDPATDTELVKRWPGFLPWSVTESFYKVKTAFSTLKVYQELGTPEEVRNAEEDVIYLMGIMGHYVGDLSQPLHTTIQHDGWVGPNPHGYYSGTGFHTWIDSGLISKAKIKAADLEPRVTPAEPTSLAVRADGRDPIFALTMDYLLAQQKFVEPLYQLDLEGKLGRVHTPVAPEGRALIENQLLKGGEYLGALWLTAWRSAQPDTYLHSVLMRRKIAAEGAATPKAEPAK